MDNWTIQDLKKWDKIIRDKIEEIGVLDCFPQEFEICDYEDMIGYMSYSGMPSHYNHWSYGKEYESTKTKYRLGVTGLPYEMIINSNPSIAYLMKENSLCLTKLIIAHCYGHNDFFKNNVMFKKTRPEEIIDNMKMRANRIRSYIEDPTIGEEKVEKTIDACHAIQYQCIRHPDKRQITHEEKKQRLIDDYKRKIKEKKDLGLSPNLVKEPELNKYPLEPNENLLLFIRDNNPFLEDWQKDIMTIIHEEAQYFIPQIETKIMNEGWASYWHHRIMKELDLSSGEDIEFGVHHSQVVRPHKGSLNPYHLGFKIWHDIYKWCEDPTEEHIRRWGEPKMSPMEAFDSIRRSEKDTSFIRLYLSDQVMFDLKLYEYYYQSNSIFDGEESFKVFGNVANSEESCDSIRNSLIKGTGMNNMPVIKVEEIDPSNRTMLLKHYTDGRTLQTDYAKKTLEHVSYLWGSNRKVYLEANNEKISIEE